MRTLQNLEKFIFVSIEMGPTSRKTLYLLQCLVFLSPTKTTTSDERVAFVGPGTTVLFPAASLVSIVVPRKIVDIHTMSTIKRKCRQAERAGRLQ